MKLALLFDHFGPYHQARLRAAVAAGTEAVGVEFYARSHDYSWDVEVSRALPIETVQPAGEAGRRKTAHFRRNLEAKLDFLKPDAVAVPGWSSFESLAALQWCLRRRVPGIVMSESSAHDEPRSASKEWVKHRVLRLFSAALVGGTSHAGYLAELGMPHERIFTGYDAVDNDYFQEQSTLVRNTDARQPNHVERPAFLASARFIEKKNLPGLIRAFARYRQLASAHKTVECWPLILLGDGSLRNELEDLVQSLGLSDFVEMPGFKQYHELPRYYARASAFVHASTTEQWGLVVNEAMASGLPVVISNRCGCAPDLVAEGVNGFTFDPANLEQLAQVMLRMAGMEQGARRAMGDASRKLISDWGPKRFAQGLQAAASSAMRTGSPQPSALDNLLLAMLTRR